MPAIRAIGTAVPQYIVTQESARAFAEHLESNE
jgi:hypothetical protein